VRIAIVHLSDIHFRTSSNVLLARRDNLVAGLRPTLQEIDAVIFAVTGDIAFSGLEHEYDVAKLFFSELRNTLLALERVGSVHFVFIPGNHDCNFGRQGDLRPTLLEGIAKNIFDLDPSGEIVDSLAKVQDEFFKFEADFCGSSELRASQRLRYQKIFHFGKYPLLFDCYNTAWTSQKDEQQGKLVFPTRLLTQEAIDGDEHLRISLLHHRDNWLEANNARMLRDYIDSHSDIVFCGHEHVAARYAKVSSPGVGTQYVEGAVLQDYKQPGNSGFNVVELDLTKEVRKLSTLKWIGQRYSAETVSEWTPLDRSPSSAGGRFHLSSPFMKELRDIGAGFFHPQKPDLALDDLFVYPDLRRRSFKKIVKSALPSVAVAGHEVVKFVADSKHVVINGPDDCGRTALARSLYLDIRSQYRLVPVLLNGTSLQGRNLHATFDRELRRALEHQYSPVMVETYSQLAASRKVIIVDDWHKTKYGKRGQQLLLERIERIFDTVICFTDDTFAVNQLADAADRPFSEYELCEIRELGHLRRNELIRKWHRLGSDLSENESDSIHAIAAMESAVNTVLGKNLLPSYPVIVLAILQSYVTNRNPNSSTGSYGQMYEALITAALASVSKKAVELGTKYTYTSHIAYYLFHTNKQELEEEDLRNIYDNYYDEYKVALNQEVMTDQLITAQILARSDGGVRFKYKYIYCYFVAKYFQDNIANRVDEKALRERLHEIADKVYFDDYANIIIFYVYLTKDRELIEYLLGNANRIYRSVEPCDLRSHVEFVNRLGIENRELVLPPTNVEHNRANTLRRKDEAEEQMIAAEEPAANAIKYDDGLSELVKFHIALKNLRILGQIVRNFPGALKADMKFDLTLATYELGLRTLHAVLGVAEKNVDELRIYIGQLLQEKRALDDPEELAGKTDRAIINLSCNIAFAMMKRISHAVGLEELKQTYSEIVDSAGENLPVRMVDYAIKLDHFNQFPKSDLKYLAEETWKNPFALRLLRDLSADYLYLFPAEHRTRQYIGDILNIKVNTAAALGSGTKKLKELPPKEK